MHEALNFALLSFVQPAFVFASVFGVSAIFRRRKYGPVTSMAASVSTIAIFAMALFWFSLGTMPYQRDAADIASLAAFVLMVLAVVAVLRGQYRDETAVALAIAFMLTVALLAWGFLGSDPLKPLHVAASRWTHPLPGDNQLPLLWSKAMDTGHVPTGPIMSDWLFSDRPPLQTALFRLTPGFLLLGSTEQAYETASVALQLLALIGAWALARSFGASLQTSALAMIAVFFMPLVLVSGVFVWPKLLAASFLLFAVALHLPDDQERHSSTVGALVGALAALSMLSHGATAFALIGVAIASLFLRRVGSSRYVAGAAITFVVLYAPWAGYQKFVDPPADRLLKSMLAGVIDIDPRPFSQVLIDSYKGQSMSALIATRISNFFIVVDPGLGLAIISNTGAAFHRLVLGQIDGMKTALAQVRYGQFFRFIPASGLIGYTLYVLPLGLFTRYRPLCLAIILSLVVWIALMFLPGSTVPHQGSMFPEIALVVLATTAIGRRSPAAAALIVIAQAALTAFQYLPSHAFQYLR